MALCHAIKCDNYTDNNYYVHNADHRPQCDGWSAYCEI